MVLSDIDIWKAIENEELEIIRPTDLDLLVQPSSVDLRLGPNIQVSRPDLVDDSELVDPTRMFDIHKKLADCTETRVLKDDQPFALVPGSFVIGMTAETGTLSNALATRVQGKSSLARFGVAVHLTAPKIDPGFSNKITWKSSILALSV